MRLSLIVGPVGGCSALAALGCGSGSSAPDTLTCDWLASDANSCWKSTALMATNAGITGTGDTSVPAFNGSTP